jgi:hypothetical protein
MMNQFPDSQKSSLQTSSQKSKKMAARIKEFCNSLHYIDNSKRDFDRVSSNLTIRMRRKEERDGWINAWR